jgi:hypothetical protein
MKAPDARAFLGAPALKPDRTMHESHAPPLLLPVQVGIVASSWRDCVVLCPDGSSGVPLEQPEKQVSKAIRHHPLAACVPK